MIRSAQAILYLVDLHQLDKQEMKNQTDRRRFLQKIGLTTLAAGLVPAFSSGLTAAPEPVGIPELPAADEDSTTVLFQGDSITDAGRRRDHYYPNQADGMGTGYVLQIVGHLLGQHPERRYRCYNRGISGHKVFQLDDRWEEDALMLQPDVLSILIGVNDYWHVLDFNYDGTAAIYEHDFRQLLDRTREALPDIRLIIGEPFAVAGGTAIDERWNDFTAYQQAAKKIAADYEAVFIPYQSVFDEALKVAPASYWCPDGVHPSIAGAKLMANAWLEGYAKL